MTGNITTDNTLHNPGAETEPAPTDVRLARLEALYNELNQRVDERAQPSGEPDHGPAPLYNNVEDWVRGYLLVTITRPFGEVGSQRWYWCQQWWRHNEAVTALTALWYGWEHARLEPTGMLGWLHELHYHLGIICSPDGPFRECAPADSDRPVKHRGDQFADVVPAPANWWNWWADD